MSKPAKRMLKRDTLERGVVQYRRDVHSAMYYLVLHGGMAYDSADRVLTECRAAIKPLARAGRFEGNKCFKALSEWIDRVLAQSQAGGKRRKRVR